MSTGVSRKIWLASFRVLLALATVLAGLPAPAAAGLEPASQADSAGGGGG